MVLEASRSLGKVAKYPGWSQEHYSGGGSSLLSKLWMVELDI